MPPDCQVLPVGQRAWVRRVQVPAAMLQHAPETGQELGEQEPERDHSLALGLQSARRRMLQTPVTKLQQRPDGWVQRLGEQVRAMVQALPVVQAA